MPPEVAIVGGGAAGAATATVLADEVDVTVFEREADVGGKTRTRVRDGCRYETGANYLRPSAESVIALLEDALPAETLTELEEAVWTFDEDGVITGNGEEAGEPEETGHDVRRLTSSEGLAGVTGALLRESGAAVHRDTEIDALERTQEKWCLFDVTGTDRGAFDAVVLTPPAPLTADLIGRSAWPHADRRDVRETIESVPYRPIASVVLHYPFELERPWYALVNEDRGHSIGWVAREGCKPGHVPDGESVLLVQCSSEFTVECFEDDPDAVVDDVSIVIAGLLADERLADPDWSDFFRWRYGAPEGGVDREPLVRASDHDLYVAGDWVVGEDRLNGALRSGLATGEAVREDLS